MGMLGSNVIKGQVTTGNGSGEKRQSIDGLVKDGGKGNGGGGT